MNDNVSAKLLQDGGFYSAEDADSHPTLVSTAKVEGAFCVWTENEVRDILTESIPDHAGVTEADVICHHYDIRKQGNVTPGQVQCDICHLTIIQQVYFYMYVILLHLDALYLRRQTFMGSSGTTRRSHQTFISF